jgi:hypothetical protein
MCPLRKAAADGRIGSPLSLFRSHYVCCLRLTPIALCRTSTGPAFASPDLDLQSPRRRSNVSRPANSQEQQRLQRDETCCDGGVGGLGALC